MKPLCLASATYSGASRDFQNGGATPKLEKWMIALCAPLVLLYLLQLFFVNFLRCLEDTCCVTVGYVVCLRHSWFDSTERTRVRTNAVCFHFRATLDQRSVRRCRHSVDKVRDCRDPGAAAVVFSKRRRLVEAKVGFVSFSFETALEQSSSQFQAV